MRSGTSAFLSLLSLTILVGVASGPAISGGQSGALVRLQTGTPVTQTGNIAINGLAKMSNLGLGTDPNFAPLNVSTSAQVSSYFQNNSSAADAYAIIASLSSNAGANSSAVIGTAQTGGSTNGLRGYHYGSGYGVQGNSQTGIGVYGTGVTGVRGLSGHSNGVAVSGSALASNGIGLFGDSASGYALVTLGKSWMQGNLGINESFPNVPLVVKGGTSDVAYIQNTGGGRGLQVNSDSDTAIWANTNTGLAGIDGRSVSPSNAAIFGFNLHGTGTGAGVYGRADSANGYGLFSQGRTGATGTKSFVIDHPLDPENKSLLHYSTEAPQPQNFYNGTVRTDDRGYATITLPAYFESINRDPRYTLTVIDETDSADFVLAKVVQKIKGNSFVIRTSAPQIEVSWRVDAIRNDRWVEKNGAPSEVDKGAMAGRYHDPSLYGQPESRGMLSTNRRK